MTLDNWESVLGKVQKWNELEIIRWLEFLKCQQTNLFQQELIRVLLDWINDELHTERIIVQDVEEDLYDGQVCKWCHTLKGKGVNNFVTVSY